MVYLLANWSSRDNSLKELLITETVGICRSNVVATVQEYRRVSE